MHILQCSIPLAGYPRGLASRQSGRQNGVETLVATSLGELRIISGTDRRGGLEFGAALEMFVPLGNSDSSGQKFEPTTSFRDPVWDPFSSSIFLLDGQALMRLSSNNVVTLVAGSRSDVGDADGQGAAARFGFPRFPVPDGTGSLFLADGSRICRVKLPTVWHAGHQATEPSRTTFPFEAEVTTLLTVPGEISGLAYVPDSHRIALDRQGATCDSGSLIYATETAVYRLPLSALVNGPDAPAPVPMLLAGCEGIQGCCDGQGSAARFSHISGLVADGGVSSDDGAGCTGSRIYLADVDDDDSEGAALRCLTLTPGIGGGAAIVTTITCCLEGNPIWPAILPNGYIALCNMFPGALSLLDIGLTPPRGSAMTAPAAFAGSAGGAGIGSGGFTTAISIGGADGSIFTSRRRTLSADMAELLDRQPDGTSDLTLTVGGRAFHVHRGILAARCDYFRQRLTGGFPDGAAPELSLPDADPAAFAALLRYLYTGAPPDGLPPAQLQPLAELADRLLLPELCGAAQAQLLATVTLENVVDLLIWAAEHGQAFGGVLSRLVSWYLEHQVEVMEHSPEAVKRLMVSCPDLAFEVHMAAAKLARR